MINIFISILIALFSFQAFTFTFQISGIRKTIINTPIQIFENSIPLNQDSDSFIAYFDKSQLENSLANYYQDQLSKFTNDFTISYFYYNSEDNLFCKGEQCDGVVVDVNAKLLFAFSVHEKMFYEIKDNNHVAN